MRNNGFAKYEIMTVIVVLLVVFAFLFHVLLGGTSNQKIDTMKDSAISFGKAVATNIESFHNLDAVYLGEAVDEGVIGNIKNPFGKGNCDISQSKVNFVDGKPYVTLRCGDYLIDNEYFTDKGSIDLYKVSDWSTRKTNKTNDKIKLYNCKKDGKEIYNQYYEELYFISKINEDNDSDYYYASDIESTCKVVSKIFYREKEIYSEK